MPRPKQGYRLANGDQVPGCTTIIGRFKDAGPLLYWAFNQGKTGVDKLYDKADEAAGIGTHAHAMFEAYRKNLDEPPRPEGFTDEQMDKATTCYLNALEWESQVKVISVKTEISLVCECHKYGCTIDEIVELNGKLHDYEWKTSNGVYVDYLLQAAAQKHAWECNFPELKLAGAAIVRFNKDYGDFAYHYFTDLDDAFQQFVDFRHCYERDKALKRRVG